MKKVTHLYKQFQPNHYQLDIVPNREQLNFTGTVVVEGQKVGRPSKRITLHQHGLKITSATIVHQTKNDKQSIAVQRINLHERYDEVRLHTDQVLYPGRYIITITFEGLITPSMDGMYPCNYKHEGKDKMLIATQFESHHARKVFPCIDEPAAKATFQLSLTTPKDEVVLSNTSVAKTAAVEGSPDMVLTTFETTPRMSTYLLAFVYGELHSVSAKTKSGVEVRSWANVARPRKQLEYSAKEAAKLLDFYAEYYDTPYPLSKLDQVALPDFDAGAMENWGLVTYREIALLTDPDNPSISQEQYVSLVVAHELAHQWFGNLVTMKWWDDLWLNESFASVMEHLALDAIHPDWKQWEMYSATDIPSTTSRDIYKDIQPVGVEIHDVALLETAFDPGIVYAKGARLLKMLREYIGDTAFSAALKQYFARHGYNNTSREDLWQAMSTAADKDIHALMTPWLVKPGMPVLQVDQEGVNITLSQKRFALDVNDNTSLWPIPLLSSTTLPIDILSQPSASIQAPNSSVVLFNQLGSGHYITQYTNAHQRQFIAQQIVDGALAAEFRINTLNDMLLLARKGDSPLTDALELITVMKNEDRDNVWGLISRVIGSAAQLTEGNETAQQILKTIRRDLAADWHRQLGWDDQPEDDVNTRQLRHTALAYMISGEDTQAIKEAQNRFKEAQNLDELQAESRGTILAAAVRHGTDDIALELLTKYESALPDVQLDISSALASTKKPQLAKKILDQAIRPKGMVRPQDIMRWLVMFLRNYYTRDIAWDFLVQNFEWIDRTLRAGKAYDYLPTYCAGFISTKEGQQKYQALFDPLKERVDMVKNITIGESDIAARIAWRNRDEQKIITFLNNYKAR